MMLLFKITSNIKYKFLTAIIALVNNCLYIELFGLSLQGNPIHSKGPCKLHFHSFIAVHCANTMYVNKRVPLLPGIIPPLAPIHTNRIRTLMTGRAQHCTGQLMHLLHTMYLCTVSILDLQYGLLKNAGLF